jgi:hypothetical protein
VTEPRPAAMVETCDVGPPPGRDRQAAIVCIVIATYIAGGGASVTTMVDVGDADLAYVEFGAGPDRRNGSAVAPWLLVPSGMTARFGAFPWVGTGGMLSLPTQTDAGSRNC